MRAAFAAAALAVVAAPTAALAATEDDAAALRERAIAQVGATAQCPRASLGLDAPKPAPVTDAPLGSALTAPFALLRRAATEPERAAAHEVPPAAILAEESFTHGTRTVRLSDGTHATVHVHSRAKVPAVTRAAAPCIGRVRSAVRRLGGGAAERRALAGLPAARPHAGRTGEGVTLAVRRGQEAGVAAKVLGRTGARGTLLSTKIADGRNFARVVMLVPDAVASVRIEYPARELKLTSAVGGNVVSIPVPLPYAEATPKRVIWFDRRGRRIRFF